MYMKLRDNSHSGKSAPNLKALFPVQSTQCPAKIRSMVVRFGFEALFKWGLRAGQRLCMYSCPKTRHRSKTAYFRLYCKTSVQRPICCRAGLKHTFLMTPSGFFRLHLGSSGYCNNRCYSTPEGEPVIRTEQTHLAQRPILRQVSSDEQEPETCARGPDRRRHPR